MAVAVLERYNILHGSQKHERRHYKKDSRFVLDLYTLTYDSHENLDSLGQIEDRQYDITDHNTKEELRNSWIRFNSNIKNGRHSQEYCYRRPSLQSRLQDGKSLQLCFVNEQWTDFEDSYIEDEIVSLPVVTKSKYVVNNEELNLLPSLMQYDFQRIGHVTRTNRNMRHDDNNNANEYCDDRNMVANRSNINLDIFRWSAELRNNVCASLEKVYADTCRRIEIENRQRSESPITCTIKNSLKKVGEMDGTTCNGRRRMNRHMLTKMNTKQLQIIIDDLHIHVEYLNEQLMKMLMERDDLHMSRDSLLVDIEDITAYLLSSFYQSTNSYTYDDISASCQVPLRKVEKYLRKRKKRQ